MSILGSFFMIVTVAGAVTVTATATATATAAAAVFPLNKEITANRETGWPETALKFMIV